MKEKIELLEKTFANLNLSKLEYKDNEIEFSIEKDNDLENKTFKKNEIDLEEELKKLKLSEELKKIGYEREIEVLKQEEEIKNKKVEIDKEEIREKDIEDKNIEKNSSEICEITCPLVGIFYSKSSPEKPNFVEVGSKVKKGDVLCIIEAMKMFTEIESPVDGVVRAIHFKDEDLVEAEDVLFEIEE